MKASRQALRSPAIQHSVTESKHWTTVNVDSWAELQERLSGSTSPYGRDWAFRGMPDFDWQLATALERLEVQKLASAAERSLLTSFNFI